MAAKAHSKLIPAPSMLSFPADSANQDSTLPLRQGKKRVGATFERQNSVGPGTLLLAAAVTLHRVK